MGYSAASLPLPSSIIVGKKRGGCVSPYTGKVMWEGEFVPLSTVEKVMRFLYYDNHSYDNRVFSMRKAMI